MARTPAALPPLPPPSRHEVWAEFLKWALGIPAVVAGALAIIAGALWLAGGQDLMWRTTQSMGEVLLWSAAILLMYPIGLFFWIEDLRAGLRRARDWEAMPPERQAAALAERAAVRPAARTRKKGKTA